MAGCQRPGTSSASDATDPAQHEFVRAFLTAHDRNDLDSEEKLVDWDDVTESSRNHFVGELKSGLGVKVTSAQIESIPNLSSFFVSLYNIAPQMFFVVVYDDPRGVITMKYPIAKKDGRYCFALRKE